MSPIDPDLEARLDDLYQRREAEAQAKAVDASRSVETKTFATAAEASKFAGEVGASDDGTARGATVRRTPDGTWVAERKAAKRSVPVVDVDPEAFAKEQARDFLAKFPDAPDADLEQFREWSERRKAIGAVRGETRSKGDQTGYDLLPTGAKAAAIGIAGLDAVARPLSAGLSDVAVKAVAGEEGVKNLREMEAGIREAHPVLVGGVEAAGALAGTLSSPVMRGATKGAQAVGLGPVAASGVGFGVHSAAMQGAREITGDAAGEAGTPFQRILLSGADGALKGAAIAKVTPWLTKAGEAVAGRFVPGLGKAATEARIRVAAAIEQAGQNVVMEFLPTIDATGVRATGPGSAAEFGTQVVLGALFGAGTKQRFSDVFRRELGKAGLTPEQADALAPALAEALDATKDTPPDPALMAEVEKATAVPPSADPAAATAVLKDAVDKGLVKPEEIASPERVAEYRQSEYEARRDGATPEQAAAFATARVEAMPPETRPDGTVAAPTMPTREALDAGLIEGPARPIVEKIVAEGGDTVSSGVGADGRPFAVGVDAKGETVVERGYPADWDDITPETVGAELDSPEAARASRPDMAEAGFADVAGLGDALARPLRAIYEAVNTTTAPNITRESPRARDSARALAGTESTRDAIGMYLKEEVKRRGIDPEKAGAVYVEDNLRGIEDQRIAESRKHEEAARALRAELDDVRRDIADEAADHVDRVTTEATSAADRAKIKASYVLAETQRRAEDSVKAAGDDARKEIEAARKQRDDAKAEVEANRPKNPEPGEAAAIDDMLRVVDENYRAAVDGIKRRARAVRKAADAEVERARADLKRTNTETRHEVETAVMRAEAKAQREKDRAERSRKYEVDPATGKRRLVRRSMDELLRYAARAETDAAQALVDAAKVKSLIGPGQPFATRADYEAARDDPAFKAFTEEVVKPLRARFDKDYRDSQGVADNVDLPTRGRELGVRMNLVHGDQPTMFEGYGGRKAPDDAKPGGTKAGADGNMRLSKSPFAHRASGQADSYNTNAVDLLLNSYQRGAENANKHRFFRDLVADGNAVFVKKGQTPPTEIRGEPAVKSVVEIPALGGREARSLYVRESMAGEIRRLVLAEKAVEGPAFVRAVNAVSVSSTVGDSFANMGNALGAVFGRQSLGIHPAAETALRLAGRADVLLKAVKLVKTFATVNRPENLLRIVDDATKGGMRDYSRSRAEPGSKNPLAWLSHFAGRLDRSARVMASKAYDRLAANGHIANPSPTSKADFLQKSGQYQRRAMGAFTRAGIETGLTPFVVAGKARLARGVDTALGNTGIRDAGMKMRAYGLAQSAASWAGTAGLAYAITYALTGKPPRDEVPLFTIDTGKNNEDGSPQFWDLARFVGQSDAMRVFGTRGYIEARRRGLSHELALDSAVEAGQSAWAALVRGPIPNAASIAAFGHPIGGNGRKTTEPAFSSEETEFDNRWGAAIDSIAPTWRLIPAATGGSLAEWANVDTSFWEEARKQLSYFAVQSGMSAEKIASLPERIEFARGAEAVNWIRKKMYEVPHEKRAEWVDRQLERITDPGTRAFAAKKLRRPLAEALRDKGDD